MNKTHRLVLPRQHALTGDDGANRRAILVASRNDKYSAFEDSAVLAKALGAKLVDAGYSGHINVDSGHRPWPEGLKHLAAFLKMR